MLITLNPLIPTSILSTYPPTLCTKQARIITEGQYPYRVVFANKAWEQMCGWSAQEVEGQHGLSFLHGEATDRAKLKRVGAAVKYGEVSPVCWVMCMCGGSSAACSSACARHVLPPAEFPHITSHSPTLD